MSQILLIFPKLEQHKNYHYMPISALCVALKLLADGHGVKILDQRVEENFYMLLGDILPDFDEVMITAYTGHQIAEAYKIALFIKSNYSRKKITLGGPHASALPDQCLADPLIDAIWTGYAERGEYQMPWRLIDIKKYINPDTERFIYISSYGCPGQCTFCATKERRELVFLPLGKVENDIDNLMEMHTFKECVMFDATLFTKPERTIEIADIMSVFNLKWTCDARADEICRTPKDILEFAVDSGLKQITIGLESGSPAVIDRMKKGKRHLEHFRECAGILSHYDIKMVSGVIFGCPGEGPEDIRQTIDFIKEIKVINPNFYVSSTFFMPLPNTEMSDMCKEYGYQEPGSLMEWARLGDQSHYSYNQYHASMWIREPEEYKKIYDDFITENENLLV